MTMLLFILQALLAGLMGGVWWHTQGAVPFGSFVVCVVMAVHGAMVASGAGRKS
jgi:hypothetical protein